MKNYYQYLIALLLLITACSDDDLAFNDCIDEAVRVNVMIPYEGQELGCQSFLELYEYNNKQYYIRKNLCIDMFPYPCDCDGNKLCEPGTEEACNDFQLNAEKIGIVGISE